MNLTANQQRVFELAESSSNNILILGKPGVGKSVLIRHLVENGRKSYTLAAPTGLAATNISTEYIRAKTLHSLFRLPVSQGIIDPTFNKFALDDKTENNLRYHVKHLIIDEISMVRADVFDFMNKILKMVKDNDLPFGGVQLICVGDFYQLPPVVVGPEEKELRDAGYESPFIFSSFAYKEGNFQPVLLNEVLRQKGDPDFIKLLDAAREGDVKPSSLVTLNKQVGFVDDMRIKLCGTNKQADEVNANELKKLPEPSYQFVAKMFGEWKPAPIDEILVIKPGAQVLVKKNGADRPPNHKGEFESQVVNGTICKVVGVHVGTRVNKETGETISYNYVEVMLENGRTANIYPARWERKVKEKIGDQWDEKVLAAFEQIPLSLAWAISIHKSQGQSFDKVHIDATKIFAAGQMYVALSRCRSIAGISLTNELNARKFWTDVHVKRFFNSIEELV